MKNSLNSLKCSSFSHIYVEDKAFKNENTRFILSNFKNSNIIRINHYKDVFCRKNQDFAVQKESPKLILAVNEGNLIYKGADVCEDFGNEYFYYTSSIINCLYDCEYCYLQGMYSSANVVIFVNLEDTFKKVEELLKKHSVYLCISYDTDILAFEKITMFTRKWIEFASVHENLKIEIRTKSTNFKSVEDLKPCDNVIIAWTLSPEEISKKYEKNTPDFRSRLVSVKSALSKGWKVRICFDPLLYIKNWEKYYKDCVEQTFESISPASIEDVSVGVFRISKEYLKNIKKVNTNSVILSYPFKTKDGVCTYSELHRKAMVDFVCKLISKYVEREKIFI